MTAEGPACPEGIKPLAGSRLLSSSGAFVMSLFLTAADVANSYETACAYAEDPRGHPATDQLECLGQAIMTELLDTISDTALEDHIRTIAEGLLGGIHSAASRLQRDQDKAADTLKDLTRNFDGSEIADVEMQEATSKSQALAAATLGMEMLRDAAAATYTAITGEVWTPWRGSAVRSGKALTASFIDAKDALKAKAAHRQQVTHPGEQVVAFRGAKNANTDEDRLRIYAALDWAKSQLPEMALAITGADGADQIALKWAAPKSIRVITVQTDFKRHGKAAPFRANDTLLELEPVLVLTLPQSLNPSRKAGSQPSGPILNMAQKAQAAAVRHLEIKPQREA